MPETRRLITSADRLLYPTQDANTRAEQLAHIQRDLWTEYKNMMTQFHQNNEVIAELLIKHIQSMVDRQRKDTFIEYLLMTNFNTKNDCSKVPDLLEILKMVGLDDSSIEALHNQPTASSSTSSANAASSSSSNQNEEVNPLIPSLTATSHDKGDKPVSPAEEKLTAFQEWICDLPEPQEASFKQFNRWVMRKAPQPRASSLANKTLQDDSTSDTLDIEAQLGPRQATNNWLNDDYKNENNFKFKKQKECIKWLDVKYRKVFNHYINQIPSPKTRMAFDQWIKEDYTQKVAAFRKHIRLVMPELTKVDFITKLSEFANIVGEKLTDIKSKYRNLPNVDFGYLPTQDGNEICQQWLDEKSWEWQKNFFTLDPEDIANDVALFILQSEKPSKKKKSTETSSNNIRPQSYMNDLSSTHSNDKEIITAIATPISSTSIRETRVPEAEVLDFDVSTIKNPLMGNLNGKSRSTLNNDSNSHKISTTASTSDIATGKLLPLGEALQRKVYRFTLIHKDPLTHKKESEVSVIYNGLKDDLKTKLEEQHGIIEIKGKKGNDAGAIIGYKDKNDRFFSSPLKEEKKLCELLTATHKKLLDACLAENGNIVKEYQEAHKTADFLLFLAAASGYYGEIFYTWFNFVGFAAGIKLVLDMFNVIADKQLLFYANVGLAIAVFFANITFSPWTETNKLERKAIISQRTLFQASLGDPVSNNPFMATAFMVFAVSGVFPELIPIQELATDLGAYIPLAASLMGSGIPYYFFYNFDADITENTWKAIYSIGDTLNRLTGQDSNIRSVAFVEALHKLLSWVERTFRFTASTFTTLDGIGVSDSINIPTTVASGWAAGMMSLSMRVGQIEGRYHPNIKITDKEKAVKEYNERFEKNPMWERAMLAMDPTISLVIGASIIIPMLTASAVDLAPATKTPAMIALGGVIAMSLLSAFTPAAKHREINAIASRNDRKAKGLPDENPYSAFVVGIDQATRALNMIFVMQPLMQPLLPTLLDPTTFTGKMGISAVLSVEFFLIFAAYVYQLKAVEGAHRSLVEDFFETNTGKQCERVWDSMKVAASSLANGASGIGSACSLHHCRLNSNAGNVSRRPILNLKEDDFQYTQEMNEVVSATPYAKLQNK